MALGKLFQLLIPRKSSNQIDDLDTNWRTIERWAQNVGGIKEIVAGANVTITDGEGPVVTVASTGGGTTFYASLTGPGETVTPGKLTQQGELDINGQLQVTGSSTLNAGASGSDLIEAGSGVSFASVLVNGAAVIRDAGTVSFQGTGGSATPSPPVQFVFVNVAPTFTMAHPTFAFFAGLVGHIYYNAGGGNTWTLLV